ncbi:nitrilase and fragile histidine triad fusion protein NitFhit-like [Babylonia areolata]|uniref:nitrilase and fragile histidine triad fusion protein NitFhit-like n=1 Tax=Babylonia areolata TaxID=304850 RepID=UPI003FD0DACE
MSLPKVSWFFGRSIKILKADRIHFCASWRMASTNVSKDAVTSAHAGQCSGKSLVGVCQMTSTADKEANFAVCRSLIEQARKQGVQMVFLPEACDYIADSKEKSVAMAESLDGDLVSRYRDVARQNQLWLSVGGFHQKDAENSSNRVHNTHLVIDSQGNIVATYDKSHLFDLDLQGRLRLCESDYTVPGKSIVTPVETPVGKVALSTCYDVRFPELSIALTQQGADILTFPSAFTLTTGMAHWEVLLRARAIENQCYVVAAAQTGKHNAKRTSYGHAMIVDPWGTVVAQCREGTDLAVGEIDLNYLLKVRQEMPVQTHRRHDLYPQVFPLRCSADGLDEQEEYQFGHINLESTCVFARSALSFAFVNIKPVLPGHMLVASTRPAKRLSDLTQAEVSDLFTLVQRVSDVAQSKFHASSVTVAVQDGPDAGQTVKHVHVHVLPRTPGDLEQNDDIYYELQKHDRDLSANSPGLRTKEEMAEEAAMMRTAMKESS